MTGASKGYRIKTLGKFSIAVLVIATAVSIIAAIISVRDIADLNESWRVHESEMDRKAAYLSLIRGSMGYGGMIHHLKNYVLRQEPERLLHVHESLFELRASIRGLKETGLNEAESAAVADLEAVIGKYRTAILRAEELVSRNITAQDLDREILIDDTPAFEALWNIDRELIKIRRLNKLKIDNAVATLIKFVTTAAIGISVTLLVLTFCFNWFVRMRLVAPIIRLSEAFQDIDPKSIDAGRLPMVRGGANNELNLLAQSGNSLLTAIESHIAERAAAEERIRESESRFKDFAGSASDWFWEMGSDLRFTYVSDRYFEICNVSPDDILGKTREEFAPKENLEREPEKWRAHRQDMEARRPFQDFDYFIRDAEGRTSHIRLNGVPFFSERGDFQGYRGTGSDITERKIADEELAASRSELERQSTLLQTTMESIGHGFAVWDAEGCLVAWNGKCLDFWYNPENLRVGTSRRELLRYIATKNGFGPGDPDQLADFHLQRIEKEGPDSEDAFTLTDKRAIHVRRYPMPNGGHAAVYSDITEQKSAEEKLKESERLLAAAIENISDGFLLVDAEDRIVLFNKRFRGLYPNSRDLVFKGAKFNEFLRGGAERGEYLDAIDRIDEWMAERLAMSLKRFIVFEDRLIGERWVRIAVRRLPDGSRVGVHVDITELKHAKEAADKANQAKSEFLSSMSHELRTPMNAILGFGQMLDFNPKEPLTESQKKCVSHILKGGQHLLELINDILDLAKIEAGKVELSLEDIRPADIFNDSLPLIMSMAEERGIGISITEEAKKAPPVRADFTRIKQVLLNLLSNAVKYNRDGGRVMIELSEGGEDMLRIGITDTGDGIPKERLGELFLPFSRLGAEITEIEGTGIGLTVCKQLIERMGGVIGYESEVGKGSTFWIELPLARRAGAGESEESMAESEASSRLPDIAATILYVEDNPANLELMELIVQRIPNLDMISAHNAELGIELARSHRPDVIVLDINLPGMSGVDALKKLRRYKKTKDIPVLALSALATKNDLRKGLEAGFRKYLTKPMQVEEVVDALKEALEAP